MTLSTGLHVAARMGTIGTESAFEVSARARALEAQGRSIIHLQIGEPDFDTPAHVREAAKRALDEGATHYAPFPGIPALREAIAADVALIERIAAAVAPAGIGRDGFEIEMLYGIRTGEQFRLARDGYRVQTLIAYGDAWYPWYMRRLAERPANVTFAIRSLLP